MTKTTIKTTNQLKSGDVVRAHGCRFKLTTCKVHPCASNRDELPPAPAYAWRTEALDAANWTGPAHWIADWIIQGNHRATWDVEEKEA